MNKLYFHSAAQDHNANHHQCDIDVNKELLCYATLFFLPLVALENPS